MLALVPEPTLPCPRCHGPGGRYYGPCDSCRAELRARVRGEAAVLDVAYEPKMNVVPNQVATKD
jgi:hypothetical protein